MEISTFLVRLSFVEVKIRKLQYATRNISGIEYITPSYKHQKSGYSITKLFVLISSQHTLLKIYHGGYLEDS